MYQKAFYGPYSFIRASLVAQLAKNLPVMREISVQFLGQEDPLAKGIGYPHGICAWRIPVDRGAWRTTVHAVTKNWT